MAKRRRNYSPEFTAQAAPATGSRASRLRINGEAFGSDPGSFIISRTVDWPRKIKGDLKLLCQRRVLNLANPAMAVRIDSISCPRYPPKWRLGRSDAAEISKPRQVRKEAAVQRFLRVPSGCLPRCYLIQTRYR